MSLGIVLLLLVASVLRVQEGALPAKGTASDKDLEAKKSLDC